MKLILSVLITFVSIHFAQAQYMIVSGTITAHNRPASGVLVMAFDGSKPLTSVVSNDKGRYLFRTDAVHINVIFYKKGKTVQAQRIRNRLDEQNQRFDVSPEMEDTSAIDVQSSALILKMLHIDTAYLDSVFVVEDFKVKNEAKFKPQSRKEMLKAAMAEQKRFANYKTSTANKTEGNHTDKVTTTVIGADTYELTVNEKNEKKYAKNDKPISETTYIFETTRRYDGVYKKTKKVEQFDKYKPMDHVK